MNCSVIITSAGKSSRFSDKEKKEFSKFKDKSVLYYSTLNFVNLKYYSNIIITYPKDLLQETKDALFELSNSVLFIEGGSTRQESVFNGLKALEDKDVDIVTIHDGCRPFVTPEIIIDNLAVCNVFNSSTTATMTTDTIKRINTFGIIEEHIPRLGLVNVQTPQSFNYSLLLQAHKSLEHSDKTYTDDTEIYSDFTGDKVAISMGSKKNIKITYKEDLDD